MRIQAPFVIALSILAQAVGLARVSFVASAFGTSASMDAFSVANSIAVFTFGGLSGIVPLLLVPIYVNTSMQVLGRSFQTALFAVTFALGSFLILLSAAILRVFFGDRHEVFQVALSVFPLTVVGQGLFCLSSIITAYLQARDQLHLSRLIAFASSIALLGLVVFDGQLTIFRYAVYLAATFGIALALQVLLALRLGFSLRPSFSWWSIEFRGKAAALLPLALGSVAYQLTLVLDTLIAAWLGSGLVAILTYSMSIVGMIAASVSSNLVALVFKRLAVEVDTDRALALASLPKMCLVFAGIVGFVVAGFWSVGLDGIALLFERGAFEPSATFVVYVTSSILVSSLVFDVCRDAMYRFFYAGGRWRLPLFNSLVASCVNALVTLVFGLFLGIYGVALGSFVAAACSFLMIARRVRAEAGWDHREGRVYVREGLKVILAIVISASAGVFTRVSVDASAVARLVSAGGVCVVVYWLVLFLMRSGVVRQLLSNGRSDS